MRKKNRGRDILEHLNISDDDDLDENWKYILRYNLE